MKIDWAALGIVAVVATVASVAFVLLLAVGIRLLAPDRTVYNSGGQTPGGSATLARTVGYTTLSLAGLLVLFGIYLIVPQFH